MAQVDYREIKDPKNPNISVILPDFAIEHIEALIQQKQLEVLSDCRSHGERGGHDVYTQTIGEQVLRKIDELSTPPKKEETDK